MRKRILEMLAYACGEPAILTQPDLDLFQNGLLDSLAVITFITALDDEFGIELQLTQIPRETMRTPDSFVERILQEMEAPADR